MNISPLDYSILICFFLNIAVGRATISLEKFPLKNSMYPGFLGFRSLVRKKKQNEYFLLNMSDRAKLKEKYVSNLLTYISFHNNHCLCYDVCFRESWLLGTLGFRSPAVILSYIGFFLGNSYKLKKAVPTTLFKKKIKLEESGDEVFIFEIL